MIRPNSSTARVQLPPLLPALAHSALAPMPDVRASGIRPPGSEDNEHSDLKRPSIKTAPIQLVPTDREIRKILDNTVVVIIDDEEAIHAFTQPAWAQAMIASKSDEFGVIPKAEDFTYMPVLVKRGSNLPKFSCAEALAEDITRELISVLNDRRPDQPMPKVLLQIDNSLHHSYKGVEVCKFLKQKLAANGIRCVAVGHSGDGEGVDKEFEEAGADHFIPKPSAALEVIQRLANFMRSPK